MKRPILFLSTMLMLSSWNAQVLTNTTWSVTQFDEELGIGHFDGDTMSFALDSEPEMNVSSYVENGSLFTISDLYSENGCNEEVGEYYFEIVGDELNFVLIEDACSERATTLVTFTWTQILTSLSEIKSTPWTLFPNPTSGRLIVQFEENVRGTDFILHDLIGSEMMRMTASSAQMTLDLSELDGGIYLLSSANGRYSQRIVKR